MPLIFGVCMAGSVVEMLISRVLKYAKKVITPLVSGIVVTLIGTNDLSDPKVTIGHLMDHYDKILSIVEEKLPGIEIYLMAYYPVNYEAATDEMKPCLQIRTNDRIREANTAVKELAKKHHARYIDINDPLKDAGGNLRAEYTIEGMHIKEEGYRAIFPAFMKYVLEPRW